MKEVSGNASTHKIAAKMNDGTSPATVNRWQKSTPDAGKIVTFCRTHGENPVIGLMKAGYITEAEVGEADLDNMPIEKLLAAIERRTKRR